MSQESISTADVEENSTFAPQGILNRQWLLIKIRLQL